MKKVIKINESQLEELVKKVIKEEEKETKKTTVTKHPAYSAVDRLERALEDLKMDFKNTIANEVLVKMVIIVK